VIVHVHDNVVLTYCLVCGMLIQAAERYRDVNKNIIKSFELGFKRTALLSACKHHVSHHSKL